VCDMGENCTECLGTDGESIWACIPDGSSC
jgi:hypothetical protein